MEERHTLVLISKAHSGCTEFEEEDYWRSMWNQREGRWLGHGDSQEGVKSQHQNQCQGGSSVFTRLKGQTLY